jgi:hypothetical protein
MIIVLYRTAIPLKVGVEFEERAGFDQEFRIRHQKSGALFFFVACRWPLPFKQTLSSSSDH